jgi:hypothetical protein
MVKEAAKPAFAIIAVPKVRRDINGACPPNDKKKRSTKDRRLYPSLNSDLACEGIIIQI